MGLRRGQKISGLGERHSLFFVPGGEGRLWDTGSEEQVGGDQRQPLSLPRDSGSASPTQKKEEQ